MFSVSHWIITTTAAIIIILRAYGVSRSCNVYLLASVGAPNENHFTGVLLISLLAAGYTVGTVISLWHFCRFTNELPLLGRCAATRISIEHFYFSHFSPSRPLLSLVIFRRAASYAQNLSVKYIFCSRSNATRLELFILIKTCCTCRVFSSNSYFFFLFLFVVFFFRRRHFSFHNKILKSVLESRGAKKV